MIAFVIFFFLKSSPALCSFMAANSSDAGTKKLIIIGHTYPPTFSWKFLEFNFYTVNKKTKNKTYCEYNIFTLCSTITWRPLVVKEGNNGDLYLMLHIWSMGFKDQRVG